MTTAITPRKAGIGIIGGLGPLAGAYFYLRLVEMTQASKDQEHPRVILISDPDIPSRVDHIGGRGPSPALQLAKVATELEANGVECIAIASATTHAYHSDIAAAVTIPVFNVLAEVGREVARRGFRRPAFAATTVTATLRLFDRYLPASAQPVYPDERAQAELMELIDAVKAGRELEPLRHQFGELLRSSWISDADSLVLACTEVPLFRPDSAAVPIIDVTDVLVQLALRSVHLGPRAQT